MRFLFISFLFLLFPASVFASTCSDTLLVDCKAPAVINDGARVRTIPCIDGSGILTVLPKGTPVTVLGAVEGWYYIQVGYKKGWTADWLIDLKDGEVCSLPAGAPEKAEVSKPEESSEPTKEVSKDSQPMFFNPDGEKKEIVGIDEGSYASLADGDSGLLSRLEGKIVLRVHSHGEAYLVHADGELDFLNGDQVHSYRTGEPLALEPLPSAFNAEITSQPPAISSAQPSVSTYADGFRSSSEDMVTPAVPSIETVEIPVTVSGVLLEGGLVDPGKVRLRWDLQDIDASYGFKVLRSSVKDPVYPGAYFHSYSNAEAREDTWAGLKDGQTYHFRVCVMQENGDCGEYSNNLPVVVSTDGAFASDVLPGKLDLAATAIGGGRVHFAWESEHVDLSNGLKLLISEHADPLYPGSAYHRISDSDNGHHLWNGLNIGSAFYFRLCQDLGGFCGMYSNSVLITVQ